MTGAAEELIGLFGDVPFPTALGLFERLRVGGGLQKKVNVVGHQRNVRCTPAATDGKLGEGGKRELTYGVIAKRARTVTGIEAAFAEEKIFSLE